MNTIDNVLPHINSHIKVLEPHIPRKDKRILVSLAKQLTSGSFLTENQANLLVKILKENLNAVRSVFQDIEKTLTDNLWSKEFRIVQKIRKISLDPEFPGRFSIEFSFNTRLKEKISKITPSSEGQTLIKGAKYFFVLNEHNIFHVVDAFLKENFVIDEKIMNFYQEIVNIRNNTKNPFEIFSTTHEKMKKSVIGDAGTVDIENLLMLQDRKIRYQYKISEKSDPTSLVSKIANRSSRKIYVTPQEITFTTLVEALKDLKRLPLLIIFEGHASDKDLKTLELVKNAVNSLNLGNEVGVYFRHDKKDDAANFNENIALLGYNKNLDENTIVAGIDNNKLPKFMIKTGWKPGAVITFTNSFRANKASVYCIDVDLVVYYTGTQPLDDTIHALL